jgi:hypothetical protein
LRHRAEIHFIFMLADNKRHDESKMSTRSNQKILAYIALVAVAVTLMIFGFLT